MRLTIGAMQGEETTGKRGRVRGGQPQIGQRGLAIRENGVCQGLAHIRDQAFRIARGQFSHIKTKFLRQGQNNHSRERAVVVLHLVQVGQGNAKLGREVLLRQLKPLTQFAQFRANIELACILAIRAHGFAPWLALQTLFCQFARLRASLTRGHGSPDRRERRSRQQRQGSVMDHFAIARQSRQPRPRSRLSDR